MTPSRAPGLPALFLRPVPLFIILWQFRLLAGELADTAAFGGILAAGFVASGRGGVRVRSILPFLAIIVLPWAVRNLWPPRRYALAWICPPLAWRLPSARKT